MESFVKKTAVQGANMDVIKTRGVAHLAILAGMDSAVSQGVMLGVQEDVGVTVRVWAVAELDSMETSVNIPVLGIV